VRDPSDLTTQAARAEARRRLDTFHREGHLESGRALFRPDNDAEFWELRHLLSVAGTKLVIDGVEHRFPLQDRADALATALTGAQRLRLLRALDATKFKKSPRPGRPDNSGRDFMIVQTIWWLVNTYELTPTRNREPDSNRQPPVSACSIVAEVLVELGVALSEAAVETIWQNRRPEDFWWEGAFKPPKPVRRKSG
jgi:hypothetical protein